MGKERRVRTLAERLADAKAETVKVEQLAISQATALLDQANAWDRRIVELMDKSNGARAKARALLTDVGIDAEEFVQNYGN